MKQKEKRKPRSYKITDSAYRKAMRRAKKEKIALTSIIETAVTAYSKNDTAFLFPVKSNFEDLIF